MQTVLTNDRIETSVTIEVPHPKDPNQTKTRSATVKLDAHTAYNVPDELGNRLKRLGKAVDTDQPGVDIQPLV